MSRVYCPQCGTYNSEGFSRCTNCGRELPRLPLDPPHPPVSNGTLGGLIPYHNTPALVGYYMAVFSLVPCFFFLGIPAMILGVIGLQNARRHPEVRGVAHSWVAILLGGLCGFGYIAMFIVSVMYP